MRTYLDIFIQSELEGNRIRIRPLPDQGLDTSLHVSCPRKQRMQFPVGTIFKSDLYLVQKKGIKEYLRIRVSPDRPEEKLHEAMEYFDHNLKLQKEATVADDATKY